MIVTIEEKSKELEDIKKLTLIVGFMIEQNGLNTSSVLGRELFFNSLHQIAGKSFTEVSQNTLDTYSEEEYLDYQIALWNFKLNHYIVTSLLRREAVR